jgi:tetratricopeptide (TPR) repeat protein
VQSQHPDADAAIWAQLGEARALLELGRHAEARRVYEAVLEGSDDPAVVWRALEGKAFTFEAEEQWDEALAAYRQLSNLDGRRFEPVAKYHIGRMQLAKGQRREATQTFRTLVEQLREAEDDEEAQEFSYVLAQAEVRLRELDPSAAPAPPSFGEGGPMGMPPGLGGPGGGDISPEQLQELIRMMQQKQQGGAGGGEAP